ncbi:MAG: hypothetical protein C0594_00915 [Marinilabiliales bacterium]|nr:MAG: hypothetical protein C0594_00915 [Marinilabiliales bacterium]
MDSRNCQQYATAQVHQPVELLVSPLGDSEVCYGANVNLMASIISGVSPYAYRWSTGETQSAISFLATENSDYALVVIDANGCQSDTVYSNISVGEPVNLELSTAQDTVCVGDTVIIYGSYTGGAGTYSTELFGENVTFPLKVAAADNQNLVFVSTDYCSVIPQYDTFQVRAYPVYDIQIDVDKSYGCAPFDVSFNEIGEGNAVSFLWDFGTGWTYDNASTSSPEFTYNNPGSYDVTVRVEDQHGCVSKRNYPSLINVYKKPEAYFVADKYKTTILESEIEFTADADSLSLTLWEFGDGYTATQDQVSHTYAEPGDYLVELIVMTFDGCTDTLFQQVLIEDVSTFFAPNAFTPNGDGFDDEFKPVGNGLTEDFYMSVFDRWGNKIFESNSPEIGWKGKNKNGKTFSTGVYTWIVVYKDHFGQEYKKTGSVTLLK